METNNKEEISMLKKVIEEENRQIGKLLQDAREGYKVTQAEMCLATKLSKNHISAIERGVSKASVHVLLGYCNKLNITPNDILKYPKLNLIPDLYRLLKKMDAKQQQTLVNIINISSQFSLK